jgi:hypothetical protein
MNTCTIIGLVVNCLINPATRLTPAEAAAILAPNQYVYVEPAPRWGPTVVLAGSSPTAGPFGEFKPFSPRRRLDGSLTTDPPWRSTVYLGHPTFPRRIDNAHAPGQRGIARRK